MHSSVIFLYECDICMLQVELREKQIFCTSIVQREQLIFKLSDKRDGHISININKIL